MAVLGTPNGELSRWLSLGRPCAGMTDGQFENAKINPPSHKAMADKGSGIAVPATAKQ